MARRKRPSNIFNPSGAPSPDPFSDPDIAQGLGIGIGLSPEGMSEILDAIPESFDSVAAEPLDDGVIVVDMGFGTDQELEDADEEGFDDNLAEYIDEQDLQKIGSKVVELFESDDLSRADWKKAYVRGLDLLGFNYEERTDPWMGACGVYHPVLTEAVVRFQSQAIMEIFPSSGPVKTKLVGKWTKEKEQQAKRVQEELNYFICDKMTEYRPETETLLFYLALAGSAFRKICYDENLNRPVGRFVPAEDFVVPYGTTDLRTCPRYTEVQRTYPNDIRKLQASGFYCDIELPKPVPEMSNIQNKYDKTQGQRPSYDTDERHTILECHADWDMPGYEDGLGVTEGEGDDIGDSKLTGIELPYIITVDKSSRKVLAIRRNWLESDEHKNRVQHFVPYHYLPGLGFYGSGLIHLIGGIASSATSILRQLVDAGTLANLPGGLKSRGLRIKGDDTPIMPGEFRDVDVPSGSIRDNITFLPYKEPSTVLHGLLNDMIAEGRRLGAAPDLPINAMTQQAPVGTTLALLERSMKVMSAVQARLHASLKQDFKLISEIISKYMGEDYEYEVDEVGCSRVEDFDKVDIIPVSDPNASSMAQRVVQYQAALELAKTAPAMYDMPELHRQMLTILGIPNVNKLVKDPEDILPMDPVGENMAILNGKPVKAALWQDHESHIKVHLAAIRDPKIAALVGQSPQASLIMSAAAAHITDHLAYAYRSEIEKQMGVPLPPPDQPLPDDVEVELSKVVAEAAGRLLGKNMREAQMQQNQQMQEDPVVQMQQQELKLKEADVTRKAAADKAKALIEAGRLLQKDQIDKMRLASQERIAGAALGVEIGQSHADLQQGKKDRAVDAAMELLNIEHRTDQLRAKERQSYRQAQAQLAAQQQQEQQEQQSRQSTTD